MKIAVTFNSFTLSFLLWTFIGVSQLHATGNFCVSWDNDVSCNDVTGGFESAEEEAAVNSVNNDNDVGVSDIVDLLDITGDTGIETEVGIDADMDVDADSGLTTEEDAVAEDVDAETEQTSGTPTDSSPARRQTTTSDSEEDSESSDDSKQKESESEEESDDEKADSEDEDKKESEEEQKSSESKEKEDDSKAKEEKSKKSDESSKDDKKKKEKKSSTQRGFKPGQSTVGVRGAISQDAQAIILPYSYNFNESWGMAVSVPYIQTKNVSGMGNASVSMRLFTALGDKSAMLTSLGAKPPTGDEEVGARKVTDWQFGQAFVWNTEKSRIFGSYFYAYRPEDSDKLDRGDTIGVLTGFDTPVSLLGDHTNGYIAVAQSQTSEDVIGNTNLGNEKTLVDATFGLVLRNWNVRFGLTVPVSTESDVLKQEDRKPVFDFGFRYNLN